MKAKDFNEVFKIAQETNVFDDDRFNVAGWWWLQLTTKQLDKMVDLLEAQGMKPNAEGWYHLRNGLGLRRSTWEVQQ